MFYNYLFKNININILNKNIDVWIIDKDKTMTIDWISIDVWWNGHVTLIMEPQLNYTINCSIKLSSNMISEYPVDEKNYKQLNFSVNPNQLNINTQTLSNWSNIIIDSVSMKKNSDWYRYHEFTLKKIWNKY